MDDVEYFLNSYLNQDRMFIPIKIITDIAKNQTWSLREEVKKHTRKLLKLKQEETETGIERTIMGEKIIRKARDLTFNRRK